MSESSYRNEITTNSFIELKKFVDWSNNHKVPAVIIGGWAVYAYKKDLGSRDIDAIVKNSGIFRKLEHDFFSHDGYESKTVGRQKESLWYSKWIKISETKNKEDDHEIEINFEIFTGETKRPDVAGLNLTMEWRWTMEEQRKIPLEKEQLTINVPVRELLIVQKIIAALDRARKMRIDKDFRLAGKIWKDYFDVTALIGNYEINKQLLKKFLKKSNAIEYIEQFLVGYRIPEHQGIPRRHKIDINTIQNALKV